MAENDNKKSLGEEVKDTGKKVAKKKGKRLLLSIGIKLLPFILIIIMAVFLLGIFDAVGDAVKSIVEGIIDFFTVDETDGSIQISDEEIDKIINGIYEIGVDPAELKLLGDVSDSSSAAYQNALRYYIRKFYEAQAVTETLNYNLGNDKNKTYGAVYVYRTNPDDTDITKRTQLTYMPYDEMKELQTAGGKNGSLNIRDYFSIDDTGNLVIAATTQIIVEKGPSKDSLTQQSNATTVTLRTIDYKSAISQYTTKMQFLIYLTMISQNPEFVSAVVDLIKDSRIEITVMDNVTTTVEYQTYKYTENKKWQEQQIKQDPSGQFEGTAGTTVELVEKRSSSNGQEVTKTTTISTNPSIKITYVKTWFCEQTITYNKKSNITSTSSTNVIQDEPEPELSGTWKTNQTNTIESTTTTETYEEGVRGDVKITVGESGDGKRYANGEIDEPTFVGLMETKFRIPNATREEAAGPNLVSGAEMLFYLLQKEPELENMETIMRYALYKYTGNDYGVTELDGSIFDIQDFQSTDGLVSSSNLLRDYIRYFENGSGAPTNADGTKYIIEDDGAGNAVVGYGVDIFNGGFAEIFRAAGYSTEIGAEVDIDFVDALEKQEIESNLASIKSLTSGLNLKEYQLHALVSRAYNCGISGAVSTLRGSPAMNFVDSYNAYWNPSTDDQFEAKNNNANFNHSLYTQYMKDPQTAKNYGYMPGLEKRRKSEWTLFQTGYYDVLGKWYSEGGSIIECAKEIHEYMEQNSYTYCVYGGNSYEECGTYGKEHGLNQTFEQSKTGYHNTCCATYVMWVLQEAGYLEATEGSHSANTLSSILEQKGWTVITDQSQLLPGDVLSYDHHVEIYAGDGKVYNAGSGNAIRSASPANMSRSFSKAYRAPN